MVERTTTSADYRLYALAGTTPPQPGLVHVGAADGAPIEVEVWSMGAAEFGNIVQSIPAPLCIGTVTTVDGRTHKGFLCEPRGVTDALDITQFRSWRGYVASVPAAAKLNGE